jgi:hypothetical protein
MFEYGSSSEPDIVLIRDIMCQAHGKTFLSSNRASENHVPADTGTGKVFVEIKLTVPFHFFVFAIPMH